MTTSYSIFRAFLKEGFLSILTGGNLYYSSIQSFSELFLAGSNKHQFRPAPILFPTPAQFPCPPPPPPPPLQTLKSGLWL